MRSVSFNVSNGLIRAVKDNNCRGNVDVLLCCISEMSDL